MANGQATLPGGAHVVPPAARERPQSVSSQFYGQARDLKREQAAQRVISDLINRKVQAGELSGQEADSWRNPSYINAVAYGGYSPDDVINDRHARVTTGTGGVIHPTEKRGQWFESLRRDGSAPPGNPQQASDFASGVRSKDTDQAKDIVDSFTGSTLSFDEFVKSREAKDIERDFQESFERQLGISKEETEFRKKRLKEDTKTALARILEDRGFFGEDIKINRGRLDQDKVKAIADLGLTESRGKEDFEQSLTDLSRRRTELTEDQQVALGRLELTEQENLATADRTRQSLGISERDETEGLQENLNQRNIFGRGVGDILRERLGEQQGLRRAGTEADISRQVRATGEQREDVGRSVERGMGSLGREEEAARLGFGRFGEDVGREKENIGTQFGRQFQDLERQRLEAERGFGRQETDVQRGLETGAIDLDRALAKREKELAEQRKQDAAEEVSLRFGEQLQQTPGAV